VADQARKEAETLKEIARIKVETATLEGKAVIATAQARKEQIDLGGGISERERTLAEIDAKARVGVAEALSKMNVPGIVIAGGGADGKGSNVSEQLMNLVLMEKAGIVGNSHRASSAK
jgi:phosphopantothenoylcysteine synthetase/decarboxylase